nr:mannose-binding lectin-associated serine protease precursor [Chrysogorgia stellata]
MKTQSCVSFALLALSVFGTRDTVSSDYRCGNKRDLSGKYGVFHSPGFPRSYPDFLQCRWTITVDSGYCIIFRFTDFDVEFYPNCTYDYVKIIEKPKTLGTYCGNREQGHAEAMALKKVVKSSGNSIELIFHSDYSNERMFMGFKVHYRAADINECDVNNGGCDQLCHNYLGGYYCSCRIGYQLKEDLVSCDYVLCHDVELRSLNGTISSPEHPENYPRHSNCTWRIYVPIGYRIILKFERFKIEHHPTVKCPYDFLSVFAGEKHGPLCGRRLPKNITSTSNSMTIRFVTDFSNNFKGFLANYYSEGVQCQPLNAPINGLINAKGFSFKDEVTFSCLSGYNMKGAARIWCKATAKWSEEPPLCQPVSCGHPGNPAMARLQGEMTFTFNKTVRFICDDFYEISGEEELTCNEDGEWSDELPACVPVCGNSSFANIYRQRCRGNIVGGNDAVQGSYPWHAYIKLDGAGICGGSLLNEFWVITAAHCVVNSRSHVIRPRRFKVVLGLHNTSRENETQVKEIGVGQIFEHRSFDPNTFEADLALLRLTEPAIIHDFVKPICLPDTDSSSEVIKPGARGVVAGWGRTSSTKQFPDILQEVCLPVVATNTCRNVYQREGFSVTHDMFCAGPPGGGKDVCKGDSGGGYIFQDPGDSRWFLGGLVSWGSTQGCALANKYGVYLKVEDYLDWIEDIIFR